MGACCRRCDRNESLDQKEAKLDEPGLKMPDEPLNEHSAKPEVKDEPQGNEDEEKFKEEAAKIKSQNENANVRTLFLIAQFVAERLGEFIYELLSTDGVTLALINLQVVDNGQFYGFWYVFEFHWIQE